MGVGGVTQVENEMKIFQDRCEELEQNKHEIAEECHLQVGKLSGSQVIVRKLEKSVEKLSVG